MTLPARKPACKEPMALLGPYLDGELQAQGQFELEAHLSECGGCREKLQLLRAIRGSLQRTVKVSATPDFRARVAAAAAAEASRLADAHKGALESKLDRFRGFVPLATAAALALVWGMTTRGPASSGPVEVSAGFGDDIFGDLVSEHSHPLPPEATDVKSVRGFERYVGVPVQPSRFERQGAKLVGGRVFPMRQQRAAMLQYVLGTGDDARRVSVLVFDPQKIRVNDSTLAPKAVGSAKVQVGTTRGYSVAFTERGGVGYAIATDLDTEQSARIAAAVYDE